MRDGIKIRGKASEGAFALQEELGFKVIVLRNRKLGAWAAAQFGLEGEARDKYIEQVLLMSTENRHESSVMERLLDDFDVYKIDCTERSLERKMDELLEEARQEVLGKDA